MAMKISRFVAVCCVVTLVFGCEMSAERTGEPANDGSSETRPSGGEQRYESAGHGFGFDYPRDWSLDTSPGSLQDDRSQLETPKISPGDTGAYITVTLDEIEAVPAGNLPEVQKDLTRQIEEGMEEADGKVVSPCSRIEHGGWKGLDCAWEYESDEGVRWTGRDNIFYVGERQYVVRLIAPVAVADRYAATFDEVVSSFEGPKTLTYRSEESGHAFEYPATWLTTTQSPGYTEGGAPDERIVVGPPDDGSFVEVNATRYDTTAAIVEDEVIENLNTTYRSLARRLGSGEDTPCRPVEVPAELGAECRIDYTAEDGTHATSRTVVLFEGEWQYGVRLETRTADLERLGATQDEIVSSLRTP